MIEQFLKRFKKKKWEIDTSPAQVALPEIDAAYAHELKLPFQERLLHFPYIAEHRTLLPYAYVKKKLLLPLEEREGKLRVALSNPFDLESLEEVRWKLGKEIEEILAPKAALLEAIEQCYRQKEGETSALMESLRTSESEESSFQDEDLLEQREDAPTVRLLNAVLLEAIEQGASDIHFEPQEEGLEVRYRIDGVLQKRHTPPKEYAAQLLTRLKVMAKLDIAEQRLPQDGRIKLRRGGREIDFRVSTLPVSFGERIVLRILDRKSVALGLSYLGMPEGILTPFRRMIQASEGILLVTGPTGSGKTTTLYSALMELASSEVNIMTIEDPVEYKLLGMAQMGVLPKIGLTFATGLRHILRQDPDIIMIGEIRDRETAEIAIQASLTGHLVLTTLHTNDAPSALTRLVDMGVEPYLLTSSVLGALAQRLVRKICSQCRESYLPSLEELGRLGLPEGVTLFRGAGCSSCFQSGYRGRCGIYEIVPFLSPLKKQLLKSADAEELRETSRQMGFRSLREEGLNLVRDGVTTSQELLRVAGGIEKYAL